MKVTNLGHACFLFESGELRVLFDPILGPTHSGGTFDIVPRRRIDAASLRPDFVFVSHAHPDHFDPESLAELACLDAETVVVTSDPLIVRVAELVGFRQVRLIAPNVRIALADGVTITTTPSAAPEVEWGALVSDRGGSVWNLIDTVFTGPEALGEVRDNITEGRTIDLALVPVQPMREIALATADHVGFVFEHYRRMLGCAAATDARVFAPSASGDAHAKPFGAMNAWAYPISRERAASDLRKLCPRREVLLPPIGQCLEVDGGVVEPTRASVAFELLGDDPDTRFRPLEPAPLEDWNLRGLPDAIVRERIDRWVREDLAHALRGTLGPRDGIDDLRLALEVVFSKGDVTAYLLDPSGKVEARSCDEYDVLNVVAASMLFEVIEGERGWGEPLLAGQMRSSVRGARIREGSVTPLEVAPFFLYYALSYRESVERAALHRAKLARHRNARA